MPRPVDPTEWLKFLRPKLDDQIIYCRRQELYYDGLSFSRHFTASETYGKLFARMLNSVMDNWLPIVVESVEERLHIDGFRFGDTAESDAEAWDMWQRNNLDALSELLHNASLKLGIAYSMVWTDEDNQFVRITPESPYEVYVHLEPGFRNKRAAALKMYEDDWGSSFAYVYLPEGIFKFIKSSSTKFSVVEEIRNPLNVVPIVPFKNRERLATPLGQTWRSEIHDVLNTQDQINMLVCNMLVASEYSAFPQRWATGIDIETDPNTGEHMQPWKAAQDRVWTTGDPEARFGQFEPTQLANYVAGIENRIQSLASRTKTPPHYLLGQGQASSGEQLKTAETGLVAKVRKRARHLGEGWEETLRLGFAMAGDRERAAAYGAETIWADTESRSESEHVDALSKLRALRVPFRALWEQAGFSQGEINRFVDMLADELTWPRRVEDEPTPVGASESE